MESDADRLVSIKALGGQLVTHEAGEFYGIFEEPFENVGGDVIVEQTGPSLTARACDVAQFLNHYPLNVAGKSFRIDHQEPTGTGWSRVILKKG